MAIVLSDPLKVILVTALVDNLNFFNPSVPASATIKLADAAQNNLGLIQANSSYAVNSAGVMSLANPSTATLTLSGTLTNFEVRNQNVDVIFQGVISLVAGGGDWELNETSLNVTSGDSIGIANFSYILGN